MKINCKQWWSTIPSKSTERTFTSIVKLSRTTQSTTMWRR